MCAVLALIYCHHRFAASPGVDPLLAVCVRVAVCILGHVFICVRAHSSFWGVPGLASVFDSQELSVWDQQSLLLRHFSVGALTVSVWVHTSKSFPLPSDFD